MINPSVNTLEARQDYLDRQKRTTETHEHQEQQLMIARQIRRAGEITCKSGHVDVHHGYMITYDTHWATIAYNAEDDLATQVSLQGLFDVKPPFRTKGALSNVQLYMRAATLNMPTYYGAEGSDADHDHIANFYPKSNEITMKKESYDNPQLEYFPKDGNVVVPETKQWRELDYMLGQLALVK